MDKALIDTLKRIGNDTKGKSNSAFIISINYVDNSDLYGTSSYEVDDYELAQKINSGNKYINYSSDGKMFTIYSIKEKIIDKNNNIILFADESQTEYLEVKNNTY